VANRGKVLFIQQRAGRHGKTFHLLKFKTMTDATDRRGELLPDDERQTRVGGWLRRTSLDELPQLLNVLLGQMSLVGPRPLLTEYLPHYKPWEMRRHEVKPGITGWQQVNGRNASDWKKRFTEDVWYVDHVSPVTDVYILFLTVGRVFRGDGVYGPGGKTPAKFSGTED
jgi:lipopolysaccharide/colanic/teichoic acid biosynthesis glycosyltransferase